MSARLSLLPLQMLLRFAVLLLVCSSVTGSPLPLSQSRVQYAGQALNALQRLLDFFERDAEHVNVDGIFCLRMAQGQLNALGKSVNASTQLTDRHHFIDALSTQIDRIAEKTSNTLVHDTSVYVEKFMALTSKVFYVEYKPRSLDRTLIEHRSGKEAENDWTRSDRCFSELLGSYYRSDPTACRMSDFCWEWMTARKTADYRITHQLLWILLARHLNCSQTRLFSDHEYLENFLCANIYDDAEYNFAHHSNEDMFIEQLLLCGMIGFEEFLRPDWLEAILTWQDPDYDCFVSESTSASRLVKRHLLTEQAMTHGCLSHKSGLAAGLLATYARFFLQ